MELKNSQWYKITQYNIYFKPFKSQRLVYYTYILAQTFEDNEYYNNPDNWVYIGKNTIVELATKEEIENLMMELL